MNIAAATLPNDDFVLLSLPKFLYSEVLQFIAAKLAEPESICSLPPATTLASAPLMNGWTQESIRELFALSLSYPTVTSLFTLASIQPGKRITFAEAYQHAERSHNHARADLASFTRAVRKRWGADRKWPVDYVQDGNRMLYFATAAFAEAWTSAVDEDHREQSVVSISAGGSPVNS
jgi:hypothetical protein